MSDFSIIIASHGTARWSQLAQERAYPSAVNQGAQVLAGHEQNANRAEVRNALAKQASGDWLIFLDADDELAPGYVEAMREATGSGSLLTPAVSYRYGRRVQEPRFWPECDLRSGNWMVVGTAMPKKLFNKVGGWKHLDSTGVFNEYDDWHLWCRCVKAGAVPVKVPGAVYIAHVMASSKHRKASHAQKVAWHKEVYDDVWAAA